MEHTARSPRCASMMFQLAGEQELQIDSGVSLRSTSVTSLTKRLWDNSIDLATEALNTEYMLGIRSGTLHPNVYGRYAVQDLAYLHHALIAYETAKERASGEIKQFVEKRKSSYESYYKSQASMWRISSTDSITLSPAGQMYVDFEKGVAEERDPMYFVLAMIPCERLWVWLAEQMQSTMTTSNLYSFWSKENSDDAGARRLETFIDAHAYVLDEDIALQMYRTCMKMEVGFFKSATQLAP